MSSSVGQKDHKIKLRDAVDTAGFVAPTTAPTAADPNWIPDTWKAGIGKLRGVMVYLLGSDGSVDVTGPICVDGYHPDLGWILAATLDGGAAINVGNGVLAPARGWRLTDVTAWATALQVHGGAIAGGSLTVWAEPIEVEGAD